MVSCSPEFCKIDPCVFSTLILSPLRRCGLNDVGRAESTESTESERRTLIRETRRAAGTILLLLYATLCYTTPLAGKLLSETNTRLHLQRAHALHSDNPSIWIPYLLTFRRIHLCLQEITIRQSYERGEILTFPTSKVTIIVFTILPSRQLQFLYVLVHSYHNSSQRHYA
ncbi:hypothetical protein F5Y15DRAFT_176934 [Xylariaceae sp. FL0016]|nr:hypothetical protein F5Y15DRAFT_176934 [Xylariaceae sp. FL0016]